MSTTRELWTCPTCEVSEQLQGASGMALDLARRAAQDGHAARHTAERARARPIPEAMADAIEAVLTFRVRLVVAPAEFDRVRAQIVRRELPVEVYADDACVPGTAYVVTPRRGVRPSTPGDDAVDGAR